MSAVDLTMRRTYLLVVGGAFVALVVLIAVLAVNSVIQLNHQRKLNADVLIQNRKLEKVTQIQVASQMRTDSLLRMALTQDPFDREDTFKEFNRAGHLLGAAQQDLQKMLAPDERAVFENMSATIINIQRVQEQIAQLLMTERTGSANALLRQIAIPLQARFTEHLMDMRSRFQNASLQMQTLASERFSQIWTRAMWLSIAAVLTGILVGWLTLRQLSRISRQIERQFSELEVSRAALKQEASHDALTGLANRRTFYDRIQHALRHARRYHSKVGVLFIDLDGFKQINDTHGHHVGDAVLTEVARRLVRNVRETDSVARLGGDEFVVLLDKVGGREDCVTAASNIERALREESSFYGLPVEIRASIGHALYPDDGEDEDALVRAADAAMYRVKTGTDTARQGRLAFSA